MPASLAVCVSSLYVCVRETLASFCRLSHQNASQRNTLSSGELIFLPSHQPSLCSRSRTGRVSVFSSPCCYHRRRRLCDTSLSQKRILSPNFNSIILGKAVAASLMLLLLVAGVSFVSELIGNISRVATSVLPVNRGPFSRRCLSSLSTVLLLVVTFFDFLHTHFSHVFLSCPLLNPYLLLELASIATATGCIAASIDSSCARPSHIPALFTCLPTLSASS